MQASSEFRIIVASPPEFKQLVAEIYYKEKFVVLISQEREPGEFDLETPGEGLVDSLIAHRVPLDGLLTAIDAARGEIRIPN